jgi:hypothetical protein
MQLPPGTLGWCFQRGRRGLWLVTHFIAPRHPNGEGIRSQSLYRQQQQLPEIIWHTRTGHAASSPLLFAVFIRVLFPSTDHCDLILWPFFLNFFPLSNKKDEDFWLINFLLGGMRVLSKCHAPYFPPLDILVGSDPYYTLIRVQNKQSSTAGCARDSHLDSST